MAMEYDILLFSDVSPDGSSYGSGMEIARNLVPMDGPGWREVRQFENINSLTLAGYVPAGLFSDPSGRLYYGLDGGASGSRIYEWTETGGFVNRSPAGNYAASSGEWAFTRFGNNVIAVSGSGLIQPQVQVGGAGNFGNLITSADRPHPKYVSVIGSFLIGANNLAGGGGVYATADGQQFMWSARNDASVWTPGVDRANFAGFKGEDLRQIRGVVGFRDFGVVFEDYGVTRLTFIGGGSVFDPQTIASARYGINLNWWEQSIVRMGRDIAYMSNSGPAVIVNGEAAQSLGEGKWRRYLMDAASEYSISQAATVRGLYDSTHNLLVWLFTPRKHDPTFGGFGYHLVLIVNVSTGEMSIIETDGSELNFREVGQALDKLSKFPLDRLRCFEFDPSLDQTFARAPSSAATGLYNAAVPIFRNKLWKPSSLRSTLKRIRPLWNVDLNGGSLPTLRAKITAFADPSRRVQLGQVELSTANQQEGGWIDAGLPLEGSTFLFETFLQLGQQRIKNVEGWEIGYSKCSVQ